MLRLPRIKLGSDSLRYFFLIEPIAHADFDCDFDSSEAINPECKREGEREANNESTLLS